MQRRTFIRNSGLLLAASALPLRAAVSEAHLIYVSPLRSDGSLSSCQAEVWYVQDGQDLYVVTASNAWRARALARGLVRTQVWVGDVGQWKSSDGRYKALPSLTAQGTNVSDGAEHTRVLQLFGVKYASEWGKWGPRFRNGLMDGSRVMLRYRPV